MATPAPHSRPWEPARAVRIAVLRALPAADLPDGSLVPPLVALARAARWPALALFEALRARGPPAAPDERLLVSLSDVAADVRAYPVALRLLALVPRHGLVLSPVGYSVLLKTHGRQRNAAAVRRVVARVAAGALPVDSVLLNSAVDALVRSGHSPPPASCSASPASARSSTPPHSTPSSRGSSIAPASPTPSPSSMTYRDNDIPLNRYLVELLTAFTVTLASAALKGKRKDVSLDEVATAAANLLRDARADGVETKVLRKCRRKMLRVFVEARYKRHFRGPEDPEIRSASEKIFETHGWNDIDSGWRVL